MEDSAQLLSAELCLPVFWRFVEGDSFRANSLEMTDLIACVADRCAQSCTVGSRGVHHAAFVATNWVAGKIQFPVLLLVLVVGISLHTVLVRLLIILIDICLVVVGAAVVSIVAVVAVALVYVAVGPLVPSALPIDVVLV